MTQMKQMSENTTEVLVGGAVLAVALGFVLYAGQVTGVSAARSGYELTASFRSAQGLLVGTDVRMAGVRVGAVTEVRLNPQTFRADTTLSVRDGIAIPDDSSAVIASEGLLGGNFLEIVPGGSFDNLEPGGEIVDTQGAVSLITLLGRFASGGSGGADGDSGE